jgi:hypothetical protein
MVLSSTAGGSGIYSATNLAGLTATATLAQDGDWGFTADGHIYYHSGGSWTVKV